MGCSYDKEGECLCLHPGAGDAEVIVDAVEPEDPGVAHLDRCGTNSLLARREHAADGDPIGEARHRADSGIGRVEVDDEARGKLGRADHRRRSEAEGHKGHGDEGTASGETNKSGHEHDSIGML